MAADEQFSFLSTSSDNSDSRPGGLITPWPATAGSRASLVNTPKVEPNYISPGLGTMQHRYVPVTHIPIGNASNESMTDVIRHTRPLKQSRKLRCRDARSKRRLRDYQLPSPMPLPLLDMAPSPVITQQGHSGDTSRRGGSELTSLPPMQEKPSASRPPLSITRPPPSPPRPGARTLAVPQ